ncbi:MAG: hypothetical protein ACI8ZX_001317 [Planctomycetota bacterium]|jgi:hypothetical protein
MSRIEETYQLIKSLSSGEKRFFKIFSNRYDITNSLIKLFDILERLNEWDNLKVQKSIEKQKIKSSISVTNTKLFNEITTALRLHNEQHNVDLEINKYIEEVRLLSKRNMFEMANLKLNKAAKLSREAEKHERLLEVILLKKVIAVRNISNEDAHKLGLVLSKERVDLLRVLDNKEQYSLLSQKIFYLYRKFGNPKNKEEKKEFEDVLMDPLMLNVSLALSSSAINSFYFVYTIYYTVYNEMEKASEIIEKQIETFENKKEYLKNNLDQYISILNNAIHVNSELKNSKKFLFFIDKLRTLPEKHKLQDQYFKKRIFETSYSLELDYYLQSNQFGKLNKLSTTLEKELDKLSKKGLSKDKFISFSYSISLNFYYQENYIKAQDVLSNLILIDDKISNLEWFCFAKILNLIVHFELKNYRFILNKIKSVKRFLKKNNLLTEIDVEFLKLLQHVPTSYNPINNYRKFLNFFENQPDNETKKFYSNYLRIEIWCSSKINNTSFKECLFSINA